MVIKNEEDYILTYLVKGAEATKRGIFKFFFWLVLIYLLYIVYEKTGLDLFFVVRVACYFFIIYVAYDSSKRISLRRKADEELTSSRVTGENVAKKLFELCNLSDSWTVKLANRNYYDLTKNILCLEKSVY